MKAVGMCCGRLSGGRLPWQIAWSEKPFLHEMVFAVRDLMQDAYPELKETAERVSKTVRGGDEVHTYTRCGTGAV